MLIPLKVLDTSIVKSIVIGELVFLRYINNDLVAVLNNSTIIGKLATKSIWQLESKCLHEDNVSFLIWAIFKNSLILEFNGFTPITVSNPNVYQNNSSE
jgi:predicted membrane-bound dolichyl-phosphate-mannose-protein mannosyltransferase